MMTIANPTPSRKPGRAYYATLHGLSGVITKPADHILFLEPESGAVVTLTEADYPELTVLGEVASSMQQYLSDMAAGGYAAIACSRENSGRVWLMLQITIIDHPTSAAHRIAQAQSRGRIYAVTYAEPFPTEDEVREVGKTERKAFQPFDETTGRYLSQGGRR